MTDLVTDTPAHPVDRSENIGLTRKTLRGLKWSTSAVIINSAMQIAYMSVMARLLDPAAYGLMAMSMVVIRFGKYFSQMGVMQALVQKPNLGPNDVRMAFTGSVALGLAFSLVFLAGAPLAELYFRESAVVPLLRVMAISFFITGLSATSVGLLRRKMNFKAIAISEVASYLLSYGAVGIPLAVMGYGVWSLVWASMAQPFVVAVMSYRFARHSLKPYFSWSEGKPLYSFGSRVSLISFLEFLRASLDTLLIGRWFGDALLGLYNRAFLLVSLPMEYFMGSFSKVFLPALSRIQQEEKRVRDIFISAYAVLQYFIVALGIGICAASKNIVFTLLGGEWADSIPMLRLLAIAASFNFLSHLMGVLLEAKAKLKGKIYLNFTYLFLLGGLFWFLRLDGPIGFAWSLVIANALMHIWYLILTYRAIRFSVSDLMMTYLWNIVGGIFIGALIYGTGTLTDLWIGRASLGLVAQIATGGFGLIIWLMSPMNGRLRGRILVRLRPLGDDIPPTNLKGKVLHRIIKWLR